MASQTYDDPGKFDINEAFGELLKGVNCVRTARRDVDLLFDGLPEPIDIDLDLENRLIYWTDRGDPPRGNTVNRACMDAAPDRRTEPEIVFNHLLEGIGLSLDLQRGRMFMTDLAGSVYSASLDGSNRKTLLQGQGNLTGITCVDLPPEA
jgi:hypothetical protein